MRIGPVSDADRLEAIERLVSPRPTPLQAAARRFLDHAAGHRIDLSHLWAGWDEHDRIVASVLIVPAPGRTAMVFAGQPRSDRHAERTSIVVRKACAALDPHDVRLAQALLEPGERHLRTALTRAGFDRLAGLAYLERPLPDRPTAAAAPTPGLTLEPWDEAAIDDWLEVLEASYEQTLDCPGLRGLRRTSDVLEGHRSIGRFEPALWQLLRRDGRPVGSCLLNPSPASGTVELVYLGLTPSARGDGLGRWLLTRGLDALVGRPERVVSLAVDENNGPARRLYASTGFRSVLRREAWILPIPESSGGSGTDASRPEPTDVSPSTTPDTVTPG